MAAPPLTHKVVASTAKPAKTKQPKKPTRPAPKPVNPVDAQVQSDILTQTRPLIDQMGANNKVYNQNVADAGRVQTGLQSELGGIGQSLQNTQGDLLNLAAQRASGTADQIQRNRDWLTSVLGNYTSDGGGGINSASELASANARVGNTQNATLLAQNAQAQQAELASMRGAASMRQGEDTHQALLARDAANQRANSQISTIKGSAAGLRAKYQRDADELAMARKELGLKASDQSFSQGMSQKQLDEQARESDNQVAASIAGREASAASKVKPGQYGFGEQYDGMIGNALAWFNAATTGVKDPKTGQPIAKLKHGPWRDVWEKLQMGGLNADQAAQLATKWSPGSITGSNPHFIYVMLKNRNVSDAAAKQIITQFFGAKGWKARTKKPKGRPLLNGPAAVDSSGAVTGSAGMVSAGDLYN